MAPARRKNSSPDFAIAENKIDAAAARHHIAFPMKVVFFAQSRQAAGRDEWQIEATHAMTIPEFWARLREAFPALAPLEKTARLARRETYLLPGERIEPQDEIAVIPPVSGG